MPNKKQRAEIIKELSEAKLRTISAISELNHEIQSLEDAVLIGDIPEEEVKEDVQMLELELKLIELSLENLNDSIQYYFKGRN